MIFLNLKKNIFLCRAWIIIIYALGPDVKVKGKIVIQAGAPVINSIQSSQEVRMAGGSGKISFTIQLVETVDKQNSCKPLALVVHQIGLETITY